MNKQAVAKELEAVARELMAAPRPWDEGTVRLWERKVKDTMRDAKVEIADVQSVFKHGMSDATSYGSKEKAVDGLAAAWGAALKLQTTVKDLVKAMEGVYAYVDVSMPDTSS